MLVIRLRRRGRKNAPVFDLVCAEKARPVKSGSIVEKLGTYQITRNPAEFSFNKERVEHWISVGAWPSETVARMLKKEGFSGMEKFVDFDKKYAKRNKKAKEKSEDRSEKSEGDGDEEKSEGDGKPDDAAESEADGGGGEKAEGDSEEKAE